MKITLLTLALVCFFLAGCTTLSRVVDAIAPAQYDETGAMIPDSREPTDLVKGIADVVPYGETGLAVFMFLVAGVERFKRARTEKGLKVTLLAGKKVANDPSTKASWEKIKETYAKEHENSGTTLLVKSLLAKLPKV